MARRQQGGRGVARAERGRPRPRPRPRPRRKKLFRFFATTTNFRSRRRRWRRRGLAAWRFERRRMSTAWRRSCSASRRWARAARRRAWWWVASAASATLRRKVASITVALGGAESIDIAVARAPASGSRVCAASVTRAGRAGRGVRVGARLGAAALGGRGRRGGASARRAWRARRSVGEREAWSRLLRGRGRGRGHARRRVSRLRLPRVLRDVLRSIDSLSPLPLIMVRRCRDARGRAAAQWAPFVLFSCPPRVATTDPPAARSRPLLHCAHNLPHASAARRR